MTDLLMWTLNVEHLMKVVLLGVAVSGGKWHNLLYCIVKSVIALSSVLSYCQACYRIVKRGIALSNVMICISVNPDIENVKWWYDNAKWHCDHANDARQYEVTFLHNFYKRQCNLSFDIARERRFKYPFALSQSNSCVDH